MAIYGHTHDVITLFLGKVLNIAHGKLAYEFRRLGNHLQGGVFPIHADAQAQLLCPLLATTPGSLCGPFGLGLLFVPVGAFFGPRR